MKSINEQATSTITQARRQGVKEQATWLVRGNNHPQLKGPIWHPKNQLMKIAFTTNDP